MSSLFVKKGDKVVVLSGEDKGATGKVLQVAPKDNKVIVEGVNMMSKHKKARSARDTGGIIKTEAPLNAAKVQVICPVCEKPTRISRKVEADKKFRICKKCGAKIETVSDEKADKKAKAKKAEAKKTDAKKPAKEKTEKKAKTE